jgi:hypothetical protein
MLKFTEALLIVAKRQYNTSIHYRRTHNKMWYCTCLQ